MFAKTAAFGPKRPSFSGAGVSQIVLQFRILANGERLMVFWSFYDAVTHSNN